ncbi:MAG: hypothetical protein JXD22_16380, partial [Sedimentisphaerales bacterium]|nr:hypothetical protein [Sedimentisphaerales bacterium]
MSRWSKRNTMISMFTVLVFALTLSLSVSAEGVADGSVIRVEVGTGGQLSNVQARLKVMKGQSSQARFECDAEEVQWLSEPGEPQIPWKVMTILLPPDVDAATVAADVQAAYEAIAEEMEISPVPPQAYWDEELGESVVVWPREKEILDGRDVAIYETDDFWPNIQGKLVSVGQLRKWQLAEVALPMVRYNPVRGEIEQLAEADLLINYSRAQGNGRAGKGNARALSLARPDAIGRSRVSSRAINFAQAVQEYDAAVMGTEVEGDSVFQASPGDAAPSSPNPDYDGYVIITTSGIQSSSTKLSNFVTHKQSLGFTVNVITEAATADATHYVSGSTCDQRAGNIRDWLTNHYSADEILYVLLIGDPHPTTFTSNRSIPMKMCITDHPTDYFFAELTCNWDKDSDGIFGETGTDATSGDEAEKYFEVYTGRIPYYGTIGNLDSILQKTIDYESETDILWRNNALLPMVPLDSSTPCYQLGEQIKNNYLEPEGISSVRFYDENYGLNPPPEFLLSDRYPATEWALGRYGLNIWGTHGSSTSATAVITTSSAAGLNDNYPTAVFQGSCSNGYPESSSNLGYAILKNGGIGTVPASRNGWYYVGQTNFTNTSSLGGLSYQFGKRLVEQHSLGFALWDTKETLSFWLKNYYVCNLYGDPSVVVFPDYPDFTVTATDAFYRDIPYTVGSTASRSYTLKNNSASALNWTAAHSANWFSLSSYGGSITAGHSAAVNITLNSQTAGLDVGTYEDTVTFTDTTHGIVYERRVVVNVYPRQMLGYWKLDETGGTTAADATVNNNDGSFPGTTYDPAWVSGKFGNALYFDGSDYLVIDPVANDINTHNITLSGWVKTSYTGSSGADWYSCNTSSGGNVVLLCITGGKFAIWDGVSNQYEAYSTTTVSDNLWHLLTYTSNGTTGYLYVDGNLEDTHTVNYNFSSGDRYSSGDRWSIGQEWDGDTPSNFLTGTVDDVRMYNYCLSSGEIDLLFQGGRAENPIPMEGASSVATDITLRWISGTTAVEHDVYIGTDPTAVTNADTDSPQYMGRQSGTTFACLLDPQVQYFWRIDEISATEVITPGILWNFTTIDQAVGADLIGYWPLDGDYLDDSGLANHGTPQGDPTFGSGKIGSNAVDLDGNDYVRINGVANDIMDNNITVAAWINTTYADGVDSYAVATNSSTGGSNVILLGMDPTGQLRLYDGAGSHDTGATGALNDGRWHLIGYSYNGSTVTTYIDGRKQGSFTSSASFSSSNLWSIGQEYDSGPTASNFWIGLIDEPLVFNRAFSSSEIAWLYNSGSGQKPFVPSDNKVPSPGTMTWAVAPELVGSDSVTMIATTAADENGVEYYFECIAGNGHNSGWQDSPVYEDSGFGDSLQVTYRVKARDQSVAQNETNWSAPVMVVVKLPGDFDQDLDVDLIDLSFFLAHWPETPCDETAGDASDWCYGTDLNKSGEVNGFDFDILADNWLKVAIAIDPSLIAHWKLDEVAGSIAHDSTEFHNDGTLINDPSFLPTGGRIDGAIQLNGLDQYIDLGSTPALKPSLPVTIALWIKPDTLGPDLHKIICLDDQST